MSQAMNNDVPWIFIPLDSDDAQNLYFWIKRLSNTKEQDEALAEDCEKAILKAFDVLKLRYNTEEFGEANMANLRFCSGSDGIAMPETCFIEPSEKLKRIDNPLRPLVS